jgi:hypothetical protein
MLRNCFLFLIAAAMMAQQPRIDQIQNNYSYLLPDTESTNATSGAYRNLLSNFFITKTV